MTACRQQIVRSQLARRSFRFRFALEAELFLDIADVDTLSHAGSVERGSWSSALVMSRPGKRLLSETRAVYSSVDWRLPCAGPSPARRCEWKRLRGSAADSRRPRGVRAPGSPPGSATGARRS